MFLLRGLFSPRRGVGKRPPKKHPPLRGEPRAHCSGHLRSIIRRVIIDDRGIVEYLLSRAVLSQEVSPNGGTSPQRSMEGPPGDLPSTSLGGTNRSTSDLEVLHEHSFNRRTAISGDILISPSLVKRSEDVLASSSPRKGIKGFHEALSSHGALQSFHEA